MSIEGKDVVNACKRHPILAVCAIVCAGLGLALYFRAGAIGEIEALLDERSKLQRKLSANVKNSVQMEAQTEVLRDVNQKLRAAALKEGELVMHQQFFLQLESDAGVKLVDTRLSSIPPLAKGAAPGGYVPMTFSLSATGTYQNLLKLLKNLEGGGNMVRINSASAAFSENPEAEQTLALSMDVLGLRK